ncbi:sulfatase [Engelhardtia mirabilis]|uniref:Choline-sulfatase n=1 Tax=Engelhardtia mirabilis TaxID=2528011 RepID=A0A518BPP7_9BACT|nr:Choline-sulfatase [Planctomycetes bacterium Pla133]QDV03277.1 Choline-sulfatase [Planctomycetes bacterium Pla86]
MRFAAPVALALVAGCGGAAIAPPPSVALWVEVDTLRADALGCYGSSVRGIAADGSPLQPSPAIDAIAREGLLFERCYSAAPWTIPSLVTQLTGRWPFDHGATELLAPLDQELVTVPEVLQRAGWRTVGVTTNFVATGRLGFGQGFDQFDDALALGHEGSTGELAAERLLSEIDDARAAAPDAPLFGFALLFEPHFRYERHAGLVFGARYDGTLTGQEDLAELRRRLVGGEDALTEADIAHLEALYQGEVAAADRAVATLRAGLEERGLWDEALILFTADHGEELGRRGWIGHTVNLRDDLVHVPLVVKAPAAWGEARRGEREAAPVSQVDLGRSLLDWLGVGAAARPEHLGPHHSFAPLLFGRSIEVRRYLFLHTRFEPVLSASAPKRAHLFGVIDGETLDKWTVDHLNEGGAPRGALVNLASDPDELDDLADEGRLPADRLRLARLRGLVASPLGGLDGAERLPVDDGPVER